MEFGRSTSFRSGSETEAVAITSLIKRVDEVLEMDCFDGINKKNVFRPEWQEVTKAARNACSIFKVEI